MSTSKYCNKSAGLAATVYEIVEKKDAFFYY